MRSFFYVSAISPCLFLSLLPLSFPLPYADMVAAPFLILNATPPSITTSFQPDRVPSMPLTFSFFHLAPLPSLDPLLPHPPYT